MNIIQGGQAGIAAQFEAAGIEIAKPDAETSTEKKPEDPKPAVADETEDENGLTAADRAELTKKHQRAIGRKHAALKEAEALAQTEYTGRRQAEERAQALQRELDELKTKSAPPKAAEPQKPKREDFQSDDEFNRATIRWEVKQEMAEERRKEAEQAEKVRQEKVLKTANERIAYAQEIVEDYDDVVGAVDMIVPPHIAEYMQESELFAELGYHFAKHPEDLESLAKLPTRTYADVQRLGVAIAKIEGKIKPFSETHKATEKTSTNGTQKAETPEAKPSPTATAPSKRPAPVITPLPVGTGMQTDSAPRSQKEHNEAFGKAQGVNLYQRKRH